MATASLHELSIRATPDVQRLLEKAAALSKLTVTEFLLQAACKEAEKVLEQNDTMEFNNNQRDWFLALLDSPPQAPEKLKAAALRQRRAAHDRV